MKYLLIAFLLMQCGSKLDSDENQISSMRSPVIVISANKYEGHYPFIILRDSVGTIKIFGGPMYSTFHKGDTIK